MCLKWMMRTNCISRTTWDTHHTEDTTSQFRVIQELVRKHAGKFIHVLLKRILRSSLFAVYHSIQLDTRCAVCAASFCGL